MKFRTPDRSSKKRINATEVLAVEQEQDPYQELEDMLTPEVRAKLIVSMRADIDTLLSRGSALVPAEPMYNLAGSLLLQQVLKESILPHHLALKGLALQISPQAIMKSIAPDKRLTHQYRLAALSLARLLYPQEAHCIHVSDDEFTSLLETLKNETRAEEAGLSEHDIINTLFELSILRPDKRNELFTILVHPDVLSFDSTKTDPSFLPSFLGKSCYAAFVLRLLNPNFSLTQQQKRKLVDSYRKAIPLQLATPNLFEFAQLAVLLAPEVELTNQGQIILTPVRSSLSPKKNLPERPHF